MWSSQLRDANAARWAGYRALSEFEELPKDDRIDVVARYEINWRYEAINAYEQAEEMKRNTKKPRRKK